MHLGKPVFLLTICATTFFCHAQDIYTRGMVYQSPDMQKVVARENIKFATVNDTALSFDIYYPPSFDFKKDLPIVIFNNGVGAMDIPRWGIYKDWARLVSANGMIGLNHQARPGSSIADGEALIDYLISHAKDLNINADKIAMWTCSANARTGMRLAYKSRPANIKSLVIYYGGPDSLGQLRQDLSALMVRAGLDAQFLNTGIDNFIQSAMQQDAQLELLNYVRGIHAFDAFQPGKETDEIILKTIRFLKESLAGPGDDGDFVLTNKNFMWLVMNNQMPKALNEFRKARTKYRADPNFQPFYNAVIREDVLNANAYWLFQNQRKLDAMELFNLAVESYPESPNAYESLSEAYEDAGNKPEAIRNAEMCLQKLSSAQGMNDNFRQVVKQSAEERIQRLNGPANIPARRAHHELVYDESTKSILLFGGSTPINGGNAGIFFNDAWQFDGGQWKLIGTSGDKRSGMRLAYDSKRKKVYSFGGFSSEGSLADLRVWEDNEWKTIAYLPPVKAAEAGLVYDIARDRLIVFGGSAERGKVNVDTWEWDGTGWKKFEGKGPGGRQAFAMVYDSKRKKTVLYGGSDGLGKKLEDGIWEYDGISWKNINPAGENPGPRLSAGYTYDSRRGLFIITSGVTAEGIRKNDTWGWNGLEWKKLADTGPASRAMGYMAYDKLRDRVVMFGGRLKWPNDSNETWEWDGKEWKEFKY